jgi:hypothetical protein
MSVGVFSSNHGLVNGAGENKKKLAQLTESVVNRKPYCHVCGIKARRHLKLIKVDPAGDIVPKNLTVVCPVCYSLHNGGYTADGQCQGTMIYLPDITQSELIGLFWALAYNIEEGKGVERQLARDTLKELEAKTDVAIKMLGTADPRYFSNFLSAVTPEAYKKRATMLGGFRFFPTIEAFAEPLLTYRKESTFLSTDLLENTTLDTLRT